MALSLEQLYDLHDDYEVLLRKVERLGLVTHSIGNALWTSHDELERLIITMQSKLTEEELDNHA